MKIDSSILKNEEAVIYKLRGLYRKYGYSCFKMSKFEEYDLYSSNKDFLVSEGVITFTDTNGKLMALKPDVTLSIVKNYRVVPEIVQRVYYNENVYRITNNNCGYKEIMQTGLECLGDITEYNLCEVVYLSAESLRMISEESVLNISHLGIISALIDGINFGDERDVLLSCIDSKNTNDIERICRKNNLPAETIRVLCALTEAYGTPSDVAQKIGKLTAREDIMKSLYLLEKIANQVTSISNTRVLADLTIVNDMNYYNGLVFRGFVKGFPSVILSGGQYDRLMHKMGKDAGGIGFAVYLDQLELMEKKKNYDTDVLLICSPNDAPKDILKRVEKIAAENKTVTVQRKIPDKLAYGTTETVTKGDSTNE